MAGSVNPYKMLRNPYKMLREQCRTSQTAFAAKYKMSRQALVLIESGMMNDLSDYMIDAISTECREFGIDGAALLYSDWKATTLRSAYYMWQEENRLPPVTGWRVPRGSLEALSPFNLHIEDTASNLNAYCRLLKIAPATAQRYANGKTRNMPGEIYAALLDAEFPYLEDLMQLQEIWHLRD